MLSIAHASIGRAFTKTKPMQFVGQEQSPSEMFVLKLRHNRIFVKRRASLIYTYIQLFRYTSLIFALLSSHVYTVFLYCFICSVICYSIMLYTNILVFV